MQPAAGSALSRGRIESLVRADRWSHSLPELEIDELRARWEANRSPALTLQLAERYREAGSLEAALEILTGGLEQQPEHVAARVAKSRCHLDLDQVEAAVGELAGVVDKDPAHLFANQLLADAHIRAGDLARARDRVDLVALLGGETAEFESRLVAGAEAPAADVVVELGESPRIETPFELPQPSATQGLEVEPRAPVARTGGRPAMAVAIYGERDPFQLGDWIELDRATEVGALLGSPALEGAAAEAAQAPVLGDDDPAATLTLGELYRSQGHRNEAVTIFRDVLERQPGNIDAARALGELEKDKGWPLSADDLLGNGSDEPGGTGQSPAREVLKRYRNRLRGKD